MVCDFHRKRQFFFTDPPQVGCFKGADFWLQVVFPNFNYHKQLGGICQLADLHRITFLKRGHYSHHTRPVHNTLLWLKNPQKCSHGYKKYSANCNLNTFPGAQGFISQTFLGVVPANADKKYTLWS